MSLLDKLARSAVREATRAPRLERYASEHTSVDEWVLDDLKATAPVFREALERPIELDDGRVYEPSADIHDDLFLGAHAPGESAVKAPERMRPSHRFGRDLLNEFFRTDAHRAAKPYTENDATGAAVYTRAAMDEFDRIMRDKALQQAAQQSQQLHEQEQCLQQTMDALDEARERAKSAHDAGQPIPQELKQEVRDLTQQREQLAAQLAQDAADTPPTPTAVVRQAAEQAAEQGKERAEAWGAIAGLGGGELADASPDQAWALSEAWMALPDFKELCKLMGRVVRDFRAQDARNVIGGTDEIVGIELGNNLTNTLPGELARLGSPLTQRSFFKDYVDESLLQFETQGRERSNLGPGILCLDASGSMGGRKILEAKAVVVGFVRLMHRKNRDAAVIVFNTRVLWEHHFPKRAPMDMSALLALAGLQPNGGTNITAAVARAEHYITRAPKFKRADVLIVTDGQSGWTEQAAQIRERLRKAGVRSHGVAIAHEPAPGGWLLNFCDDAISVRALTEATGDIVRAVS